MCQNGDLNETYFIIERTQSLEITAGIWNSTIWNQDFLKVGFQIVRFSDDRALALKKMAAIC